MPSSSGLCSLEKENTKGLWLCLVFFGSISASDSQDAFALGIKRNGTANGRIWPFPRPDYFHLIHLILGDYSITSETNKRNDGGRVSVPFEELWTSTEQSRTYKQIQVTSDSALFFCIRKSYSVVRETAQVPTHGKHVKLWRVTSLLKLKNNHLKQGLHNVKLYRS